VSYSDINNTRLLVEIAFARDGYTPEVSYGTHFFQDLVEADIAIMPLYPDTKGSFLNEKFLLGTRNAIADVDPTLSGLAEVIRVINVPSVRDGLLLNVFLDAESQRGIGMFAPAAASAQK
jgi:hypothetical protein